MEWYNFFFVGVTFNLPKDLSIDFSKVFNLISKCSVLPFIYNLFCVVGLWWFGS